MKKYDWSKEIDGGKDVVATIFVMTILIIVGTVSAIN